jgi:hypothetical protein
MVIDLTPEQRPALSMLAEDIEHGAVSESRRHEPRFTLAQVEAELRALGKLE